MPNMKTMIPADGRTSLKMSDCRPIGAKLLYSSEMMNPKLEPKLKVRKRIRRIVPYFDLKNDFFLVLLLEVEKLLRVSSFLNMAFVMTKILFFIAGHLQEYGFESFIFLGQFPELCHCAAEH